MTITKSHFGTLPDGSPVSMWTLVNDRGLQFQVLDYSPYAMDAADHDEDIEKVKVEYFDLSLLKYVTKVFVNENGVERVIETGNTGDENDIIPYVQMKKKNLDKTVVKFVSIFGFLLAWLLILFYLFMS